MLAWVKSILALNTYHELVGHQACSLPEDIRGKSINTQFSIFNWSKSFMVWVVLCRHRVVCGRIYPEAVNMPEDIFLERVFGFLLVSADFVSSRCFVLYFALQSHLGLACQ
jgi:hypothetical protein